MQYIIQVIAYTGILWLLYMLLLRNKPLHAFNRAYLLAASVMPLLLPLLFLPKTLGHKVALMPIGNMLPEAITTVGVKTQTSAVHNDIPWLAIIYMTVVVIALIRVALSYNGVRKLTRKSKAIEQEGYTLLQNTGYGPGSWGKYIFLPEGDVDAVIIKHELAHIQLKHSADLLVLSILQCICWPNIFLHAIKKELRQVHEFEADARSSADKEAYGQLLIASVFDTCTLPLSHSFIIHPIKRRIMMLNKKMSKPSNMAMRAVAVLLVTVICAGVVTLQSCRKERIVSDSALVTDLSKQPSIPDASKWNDYIGAHLKYPEQARRNKLEGRVVIKCYSQKPKKARLPAHLSCAQLQQSLLHARQSSFCLYQ